MYFAIEWVAYLTARSVARMQRHMNWSYTQEGFLLELRRFPMLPLFLSCLWLPSVPLCRFSKGKDGLAALFVFVVVVVMFCFV